MTTDKQYIAETHIVEEVPGVPENEKYFLWHKRAVAFRAGSKAGCEEWARDNGITVDAFYPFEP